MLGGFLKNIGNIYHDIIDILVNKLPGLEEYCWDQRLLPFPSHSLCSQSIGFAPPTLVITLPCIKSNLLFQAEGSSTSTFSSLTSIS